MKTHIILIVVILAVLASSCKNNNEFNVDISDIEVNINTKHFEKDLFKFNVDSSDHYLNLYRQKYGEFFKLFNYQVVEMGSSEDKHYAENLDLYVRYWENEDISKILEKEFPDFEKDQLPSIEEAFK